MCMEDVRIGRKTVGGEQRFTVGTSALQVLSGSPMRYSLVLGAPLAGTLTYSPQPSPTSGRGLNITAGQPPILLSVQEHGDLVRQTWFVIGDAASRVGSVLFTELAEL